MSGDIYEGGPQPSGPTYEPGDARAVKIGWLNEDGSATSSFQVVLEFPAGPPEHIPMNAVWSGLPLRLTIK
jgi:hypothetical protein